MVHTTVQGLVSICCLCMQSLVVKLQVVSGLGKGIVVKKLSDSHFYKSAETFTKKNVSKEDVIFVGDTALVLLYGGSCAEGLDSLRYKWFCDKVPKNTSSVDPQSLPLTSAAAKDHSLRVHYKVIVWKEFNHNLKPEDWGWYMLMTEDLCPYRLISQQHR